MKDDAGWRYFNQWNSKYPAGQWIEYQGNSYYFMDNGYMATGWRYLNGIGITLIRKKEVHRSHGNRMDRDSHYNSTFYTNR